MLRHCCAKQFLHTMLAIQLRFFHQNQVAAMMPPGAPVRSHVLLRRKVIRVCFLVTLLLGTSAV
jgi:hypothetical protein